MKILIVAATKFEIEPLIERFGAINTNGSRVFSRNYKEHELDFLITGIGMVATAYHTGKVLNESYDAAINIGICGSFSRNIEIGSVVNVYDDRFSELGAEDDGDILTLEELNLTVNTSHGNEDSIKKVYNKFHPYTESMEGAAFMFVCEQENIPYVQIRAVSNYVEKRNREAWNIPLAIVNLNKQVFEIIEQL